jgi:hypothetical protein
MRRPPTDLANTVSCKSIDEVMMRIDEFLDAFYGSDAAARQAMIMVEPHYTGEPKIDSYVAAVAEHLAQRWDLTIPPWVNGEERVCPEPWFVGPMGERLAALYLFESPVAFRRRRIFTEAQPLRRARMPQRHLAEHVIKQFREPSPEEEGSD